MQYYQEAVALGSKTGLSLVSRAGAGRIRRVYQDLWQAIFAFEKQFSRFLPGSELSMFNRSSGTKQPVSPEFRSLLLTAQELASQTDGLYNPFILPALQSAGYVRSRVPGHELDQVDDYANRTVVSADRLEIGDTWARIPYGTALDLGGCGKGYLADQLRELLPDSIDGYWLSLGGDIAVGGCDEQAAPWSVNVQAAETTDRDVATLQPQGNCGVATSGTTVHRGRQADKAWHHLIDPRSLRPAKTNVLLATVCAKSTLMADVLASCAVILGSEAGLPFLASRGVETAVLQCQAMDGTSRIVHYGNGIISGTAYA